MKNKLKCIIICTVLILAGLSSVSNGQSINEKTLTLLQNPVVEITSPDDGTIVTEPWVVVEGTAYCELPLIEYGYTILYPGGGTMSEFWELDPPVEYYEFSMDISLVEGSEGNLITVYAKDGENNQGDDSVLVIYNPSGDDTEPPVVVITYPEDGMTFTDPDLVVHGYGSDNIGITSIGYKHEWVDGSDDTGTQPIDPPMEYMMFDWDITLHEGWNKITVYLYDAKENMGEDIVEVEQKTVDCDANRPKITDDSGNTTFFGLFVGCNYSGSDFEIGGGENAANAMYETLKDKEGWDESRMGKLTGDDATRANIRSWINKFKDDPDEAPPNPQPGDEFLFFFSGHGSNQSNDPNGDETDGHDESILANDTQDITDDDLSDWLSGFPECVTITVKLDACHSGGFADGTSDVQHAENANGSEYGPNKINIETSCGANEESYEDPYFWEDDNDDGIATPDEYVRKLGMDFTDQNNNGQWDPGEPRFWWNDKDNDSIVDADELLPWTSKNVSFMTSFVKEQLEGLEEEESTILLGGGFLNADRNQNGIVTTREWYEYAIKHIYEAFEGDTDGDGLVDEDDAEYDTSSGFKVKIYIDNDRDGFVNEDPAPPSSAFWPNENPEKPNRPEGTIDGNIDETYTYSSETQDSDLDDVFYLFDWGDETTSGWLGPYVSGQECTTQHSWSQQGDYQIKVKARDRLYAESPWSDPLSITMPKNRAINGPFFNFFVNHPELFPILRLLFQRLGL
jgi:hypothetical protein